MAQRLNLDPVISPIVNLNGTSKRSLLETNRTAYQAVGDTHAALQQAEPHPRDYPGREAEFQAARRQHIERLEALDKVRKDLDEIAERIDAQGSERILF